MATNINAYLNSCVPDESRGLANSVYSGIESAGGAIAPAVCGMLLPHAGYSALWLLLSLLSLAIAMAYAAIGRLNSR